MMGHFCVLFLSLAVLAFVSPSANAEEKVVEGCKVVKVEEGKLFITHEGKDHSAPVAKDAKITVDGKDAKLADLKKDQTVKLTIRKEDSGLQIIKIEASK